MKTLLNLFQASIAILLLNCHSQKRIQSISQKQYKSKDLIVTQIAENSFIHTSFLQTNDFGNVPCNGLIVKSDNEAVIFDTPTNAQATEELIIWVNENLKCKISAIIPTHFHNDCLGGLQAFHARNIPSYANFKTIEFAKENKYNIPQNSFKDSLVLKMGNSSVVTKFFGEGHTKDNVIGYFPNDKVMFGGCLIKELGATKGYLGDANLKDWSITVAKVKTEYPNVKIVVPGHGKYGGPKLLDYTMKLFRSQ